MNKQDLSRRLARAVRPLHDPPQAPGFNYLEMRDLFGSSPRRSAAVLVAVVDRRGELSILLTRRNDQLSQHAGQVSFPGGAIDPEDTDALAAALRETNEETGIASASISPIGYLDIYETVSSYSITPVVAWLDADYRATPDPREVAAVFEVPLAFFLDPANLRTVQVLFAGKQRAVHEFLYADERIWGVTAAMLLNLLDRMQRGDAAIKSSGAMP